MAHFGLAEVEMHSVVDDGYRLEVKVAHAVDLQLECQCWLQVTVNTILLELITLHNKLLQYR